MKRTYPTLSILLLSLLSQMGCSSSDSDSSSDSVETYSTEYLPENYKLTLPDSLASTSTDDSGLRIAKKRRGSVSSEDLTEQSYGYAQLKDAISHVTERQKQMDAQFLYVDAAFSEIKDLCDGEDTCELEEGDVEITISDKMVEYMKEEVQSYYPDTDYLTEDEQLMLETELTALDDLVGETEVLPALTYTDLSSEGGDYDRKIEFSSTSEEEELNGSYSNALMWNDEGTKVSFKQEYDMTMIDASFGSGYDLFTYDDEEAIATVRSVYTYGEDSFENSLILQRNSDYSDTNGVNLSATIKSDGLGGSFTESLVGFADDDGGYLETNYTSGYYDVEVTAGTFADGSYVVVPEDTSTSGELDWSIAWGYIYAVSGDTTIDFWATQYAEDGQDLEDFKVYGMNDDGTYGSEVTGVTISVGDFQEWEYDYKEAFDREGDLTASAYNDGSGWIDLSGDFSDSEYDDVYSDNADDYSVGVPTVTVTNVAGTDDLVIVRDGTVPDGENWEDVIGQGWYDYTNEVYVYSYWGTEDEMEDARVYVVTYDYDQENPYIFTLDSNARVEAE